MSNQYMKQHLEQALQAGVRRDGRGPLDLRDVEIEYGVSSTAHGSARVKAGNAEVIAGVKIDVATPYPDTPNKGALMVMAELLPMSHKKFEAGPPSIDSIETSRVIDRTIRESETINMESLCITEGEKVWMVAVDIMPVSYDGSMIDLGALAAMAALKDAKLPTLNEDGTVEYEQPSKDGLDLSHTPVAITVFKYGDNLVVDPTEVEENYYDARLTIATLEDGTPCALQKGGKAALTVDEIEQMIKIAQEKGNERRKLLK